MGDTLNVRLGLRAQPVDATPKLSSDREEDVVMKQRPRIYYSAEQKALMWDRWRAGDSLHEIARLFDRYISARKKEVKPGTINRDLAVVRRILNLAARSWREENGQGWLDSPPLLQQVPDENPRKPYPLNWDEQVQLLQELPKHLAEMVLFKVNTGTRQKEVCELRWEWEYAIPELDTSIFIVPAAYVKNKADRIIVLNTVAAQVLESRRKSHKTHVFSYRGKPLQRMNNSAWRKARQRAELSTLRVHDLKHTFGRRLRAAGVSFEDRQDLLGHKSGRITTHYSPAEISNLIEATNRVVESRKTHAPTVLNVERVSVST
jgi:integrase